MADKRRKTLQYRQVAGLRNGRTLQGLLRDVLRNTHQYVDERSETVAPNHPGDQVRRCVNYNVIEEGTLCGELIEYVPGTNKQAVTVQEHQQHLAIAEITPPVDEQGNQREFIDSVLYFAVQDNHLVLVQAPTLRDRDMENHLNWLLGDEVAEVLVDAEAIGLRKELSAEGRDVFSDVRSISIGSPLVERVEARNNGAAGGQPAFTFTGLGLEILKNLLGDDAVEQIGAAELANADNLEVQISIRRRGGSNKPGPENATQQAMSAVTTTLRHQYEEDLTVETRTQGNIKGDTLFLKTNRSVDCPNGVPSRHDVFAQMRQWLAECLANELVDP